MPSSGHVHFRMSDNNGDLCNLLDTETDNYGKDLYFQEESDLLVPSPRHDQSSHFSSQENGDCDVWLSSNVNISLLDNNVDDAAHLSRFRTGMSSALSHDDLVGGNARDGPDALHPPCRWENPNWSSGQSTERCHNLDLNRKINAWLYRHPEKDGSYLSSVLSHDKTPFNETHAVDLLHDNNQMLSANPVPQMLQVHSCDVNFQTECKVSKENRDSLVVGDERGNNSFVLGLEVNGKRGGDSKRGTETVSGDQICVDYKRENWDLGIDNCLTVDGNRGNVNESFQGPNKNRQTGDRIHKFGDGNNEIREKSHQNEDGSRETRDRSRKTRDRRHHIGDCNDQNADGSHTIGDGNRLASDGSHQAGDSICQAKDGSHQTGHSKHATGDDRKPSEKDSAQNEDGIRSAGEENHHAGDGSCTAGDRSHISGDGDKLMGETNVNNHRIPCMSMKKKLNQDLLRLTEENFCLSAQNHQLRENIRCVRKSTVDECSKILDSIISYCECQANCHPETRTCRPVPCLDTDRIGAGCSTGGCGGYTPSGWNRLLTLHSLECDDPCCPCRCPPCPCTCACVDDDCGTRCTCHVKPAPVRKRKTCNFTCDSTTADENASAIHCRPSAKILGELAFQLERRILDYVFGLEGSKRRRFYGYTVNNINQMIVKESKNHKGEEDPGLRAELDFRLSKLLMGLKQVGYSPKIHGDFAQIMINRYGLLACPPDAGTVEDFGLQNAGCISKMIPQLARGEHEASKFQVLLRGLQYLSKLDNGPLFIW